MRLRLVFIDKVRILLLQLLKSHHVLCLLSLGHGHGEVVEAGHGQSGGEAGGGVAGLKTILTLHTSARTKQSKLSVNSSEHVSDGSMSLESLQSTPAHHGVNVSDRFKILTCWNSVVEQIIVPENISS